MAARIIKYTVRNTFDGCEYDYTDKDDAWAKYNSLRKSYDAALICYYEDNTGHHGKEVLASYSRGIQSVNW